MSSQTKRDDALPTNSGQILLQTLIANRVVSDSGSGLNPYELRNDRLIEQVKEKVRYKNGITLPASAKALMLDANRKRRHSRILDGNIRANTKTLKPVGSDAHHIVAAGCQKSSMVLARTFLFNWGIGINDADNGVYLPRSRTTNILAMPNAVTHEDMHTDVYYYEVTLRLSDEAENSSEAGRNALRIIRKELISGAFPT